MTEGTKTLTLTEFLLARIAEDEAVALAARPYRLPYGGPPIESVKDWRHERAKVEFQGRWMVSRVLAECEAKRRIVEEHPSYTHSVYGPLCVTCASGDENGAEWPCPTVRMVASVYADHADYRDEWRP